MIKNNSGEWKTFLIKDLFLLKGSSKKSPQVPTGARIPNKELIPGDTPRITVAGVNNGVVGYFKDMEDKNYRVYNNFISVSFLGTVFYHSGCASLEMKVHCLKLKDMELTENIALFLVTVIRAALVNFKYSDQVSSTVLPLLEILLPVDLNGNPDWGYIESYMDGILMDSYNVIDMLMMKENSM